MLKSRKVRGTTQNKKERRAACLFEMIVKVSNVTVIISTFTLIGKRIGECDGMIQCAAHFLLVITVNQPQTTVSGASVANVPSSCIASHFCFAQPH